MLNLKLPSQTAKVERNGYTFQIDPDNPHVRYFGGGGSKVKQLDPFAGTGYRELYNQFTDWLQPNVGGVTAYPGPTVPGPSGLQQQGFDVAQGLTPIATGGQEYFGDILGRTDVEAPGRAMGMAERGLSDVLQPFDPSTVTEGLQPGKDLAMNTFFREFMPRLKESMVSRAGTADTGALGRLAVQGGRDLSLGLGAQAFPYLFQGQQNQFGRQQTGVNQAMNLAGLPGQVLGQAGQIGGMGADLLGQQMNIGGIQRGITGQQMGEDVSKWQFEQPWANPYMNMISALSSSAPRMDYVNQQQGPGLGAMMMPTLGSFLGSPGGMDMMGSLAGGLGGLFGGGAAAGGAAAGGLTAAGASAGLTAETAMLMAAMCDERVKENIKPIEDALDKVKGIEGKTYNYLTSPNKRDAGIIAQQLEKVLPEGIVEKDGVKFVKLDAVMALLVNAVNELDEKVERLGA